MFCLRTWIPVLFFLINVSPIYFILFVSATYYLNRPCLYCSLLLTVLVFSLYDWRSNWFEPRNNLYSPFSTTRDSSQGSQSIQQMALESASAAASTFNSTAQSVAQAALRGLRRQTEEQTYISGAQWLRELIGKKEWRIPCIDVMVRL